MIKRSDHTQKEKVQFTTREIEIMTWSARGKTYGEIAVFLAIQEDTAKAHIENVRKKLNATNKTHAIAIAISPGYIKL